MKPLLIILSLFFSLTAFGQSDSGYTNKAEAKNLIVNGKKEGKWIKYFSEYNEALTDSTSATFYSLVIYKGGELYGKGRNYYMNGQLNREVSYKNGKLDGLVKVYVKSGIIKGQMTFAKGVLNGPAKEYYDDGKVKATVVYTNGVKGVIRNYDENGKEIK